MMRSFLFLLVLVTTLNVSAKECSPSLEAIQKKLLTRHIYKYPLTYGKSIEVVSIDTISCSDEQKSHFMVHYNDIVCFDFEKPDSKLLKCSKVRCQNQATIKASGNVDFETASVKSCFKIK